LQGGVIDELKVHVSNDVDDISIHNQVVGRSNVGTAFYLFNHQVRCGIPMWLDLLVIEFRF
jgi:hypothetical protein